MSFLVDPSAAHDVFDGGVAQSVAEMALRSGCGVHLAVPADLVAFIFLWSKSATRAAAVVSRIEWINFWHCALLSHSQLLKLVRLTPRVCHLSLLAFMVKASRWTFWNYA